MSIIDATWFPDSGRISATDPLNKLQASFAVVLKIFLGISWFG
ncbi:hypothetical protein XBKQ1_2610004 [Xenorhabdus bovienii str. kraussei Quebec]|uniref:Uncharacterized protein n=1 Tax=Xenorhabdus bovienii str. kraussei Quebec TaxID=1398203 RepID=A0A077PKT6_XENBV|nr:hypothetical protein XBKQ1_2610004 [Xenorhabdus bovienii str. kraussei Quebec]